MRQSVLVAAVAAVLAVQALVVVEAMHHDVEEWHFHDLDPIGRKIFGGDSPARMFCPAWSGHTRRTNYIDVCKKTMTFNGTTTCRAVGYRKVPGADPIAVCDLFSGAPLHSLRDTTHPSFMTLTYVTKGSFTHLDGSNKVTTVKEGDAQWFAGGMDGEVVSTVGADIAGLQLFLSIPVTMPDPRRTYREFRSDSFPVVNWELEAGEGQAFVKVLSGTFHGETGPISTPTSTLLLDVTMPVKSEIMLPLPTFMEVYIVVISGEGRIGGDSAIDPVQLAEGLYDEGIGEFDFERRPGRVLGTFVIGNMGLSLHRVRTGLGYGSVDELVVTATRGNMRFVVLAAELLDTPKASGNDITSILQRKVHPPRSAAARALAEKEKEIKRKQEALKRVRRRAMEKHFSGRDAGWEKLTPAQLEREEASRAAARKRKSDAINARRQREARQKAAAEKKKAKEAAAAAKAKEEAEAAAVARREAAAKAAAEARAAKAAEAAAAKAEAAAAQAAADATDATPAVVAVKDNVGEAGDAGDAAPPAPADAEAEADQAEPVPAEAATDATADEPAVADEPAAAAAEPAVTDATPDTTAPKNESNIPPVQRGPPRKLKLDTSGRKAAAAASA